MGVQQSADRISDFFRAANISDLGASSQELCCDSPQPRPLRRGEVKPALKFRQPSKMSVQGGRVSAERKPRRGLAPGSSDNLPRRETRIGGRAFASCGGEIPLAAAAALPEGREFRGLTAPDGLCWPRPVFRGSARLSDSCPSGGSPPDIRGRRRDSRA